MANKQNISIFNDWIMLIIVPFKQEAFETNVIFRRVASSIIGGLIFMYLCLQNIKIINFKRNY